MTNIFIFGKHRSHWKNSPKKEKVPDKVNVYLSGYMRAKVKNIEEVDLTNLTSRINMDLIYDIYFGDLFESDKRFKEIMNND